MKIRNLPEVDRRRRLGALTLIEVIGVLVAIACMCALLVGPTINTINAAKAIAAVGSYNSLKIALTNHVAAFGSLGVKFNSYTAVTPADYIDWDQTVLINEGFLTSACRLGVGNAENTHVNLVPNLVPGGQANNNHGYQFFGVYNSTSNMTWVVEIVVPGVTAQNAFDISTILDGPSLTPANVGMVDTNGKVTYDGSTMYMYVQGY